MPLTKRTGSTIIYLQAKHFCLWQELKQPSGTSEEITVNNPKTGDVVTKHGYKYDTVEGHIVDLVKYDTEKKYATRYYGFKLHIQDGANWFVLDMPYTGQMLRRFLRVVPNVDWNIPLSITVFKGKDQKKGTEQLGVWFRQNGETVKPYYTREQAHDMPQATQDPDTHEWDFKAQHRWLVDQLQTVTLPDIKAAAARVRPPVEPQGDASEPEPSSRELVPPSGYIDDDDVPF